MPRKLIPYLDRLTFLLIVSLVAAVSWFWPASFWFHVKRVHIESAPLGKPLLMLVDREINFSTLINYQVTIHQWKGGDWRYYCRMHSGEPQMYKAMAVYPDELTLQWWTDGKCHPLPKGQFMVTTTWTLHDLVFFFDKRTTVESNIFSVE